MKKLSLFAILALAALHLHAAPSSDQSAYKAARSVVPAEQQNKVLSFYGKGNASQVKTWFIKFFDPGAKSNARIVVVENGKVERFNAAEGQEEISEGLSFDPASCRAGVDKALKTATSYAKESLIPIDSTRVYLNRPSEGKPPVWTVEVWHQNRQQGYIYANSKDGSFAGYRPPVTANKTAGAEKRGTEVPGEVKHEQSITKRVEDTFLEIGGDLEEFFTGERTVDKEE